MSSDEVCVLLVSGGIAALTWARWLFVIVTPSTLGHAPGGRRALVGAPVSCLVLLWLVLRYLAADDVREAPEYLALYAILGAAWVGVAATLMPWLGIMVRDDVIERRNVVAAWVVIGGLAGVTLCYGGANIGNGPGWHVVVFSGLLSTGALLGLWVLVESLSAVSDAVTIERDRAVGLRFAALLVAWGLILGRAVAGDWSSSADTLRDFVRLAWPAPLLAGMDMVASALTRSDARSSSPPLLTAGVLPAGVYLLVAAGHVINLGWW